MSTIEVVNLRAAGRRTGTPPPRPPGAGLRARRAPSLAAGVWLLVAAGCGDPGNEFTIDEARVASEPSRRVVVGATSEQRFGRSDMGAPATSVAAQAEDEALLHWTTPPGWTEVPSSSQFRLANHEVGGDPRAECYVSVLPGNAGGLVENVNRWRSQMGLEPMSAAEVEALETIEVLGRPATLVDVEGTFTGMGEGAGAPDFRLIGAILAVPSGETLFVKMTGPSALLDAERESFIAFCASLHPGHPGGHGDEDGGPGTPGATGAGSSGQSDTRPVMPADPAVPGMRDAGPLAWSVPEGWRDQGPRPMRAVSFELGAEGRTECYVSILAGTAGGRDANLNRWREQMGLEPLSSAELEALPEIAVLGRPVKLIEAYGDFAGMGDTLDAAGLLGVVCTLPAETLFVKMIGPADDVRAGKQAFVEFCASLEVNG